MKRLLMAGLLLASFGASASNVGVNNSDTMRGNVNLECTSPSGDVLEVDGELFPQTVQIQSEFYDLKEVKKMDGQKVYAYKRGFNDYVQFLIIQNGNSTGIYNYNNSQSYSCNKEGE